jgi:hypothetical protein
MPEGVQRNAVSVPHRNAVLRLTVQKIRAEFANRASAKDGDARWRGVSGGAFEIASN